MDSRIEDAGYSGRWHMAQVYTHDITDIAEILDAIPPGQRVFINARGQFSYSDTDPSKTGSIGDTNLMPNTLSDDLIWQLDQIERAMGQFSEITYLTIYVAPPYERARRATSTHMFPLQRPKRKIKKEGGKRRP